MLIPCMHRHVPVLWPKRNHLRFVFNDLTTSKFTLQMEKMTRCQALPTSPFRFQVLPIASFCVMCFKLQVIRCNSVIGIFANMLIYLLTAIGLTPGGSSTVHIYTKTIQRTTQLTNWEECGPCPVFASYTLAFALQLRKKHGQTSVRVAEDCQLARRKQNIQNRTYIIIRIHKRKNKNT
jgi:hypothetical protein